MDVVNSTHSYATGGTSVEEFWYENATHPVMIVVINKRLIHYRILISNRTNPKRLGDQLQTENEESCTTYNMLKVCFV